ncbi:tRNA pseudouridine55 synthase [Actinopolyspora alba]|uniref:tRNA pseudouridine synthase B n=1 Tax=Actinopolyspora alba TaxID=673379 RepID=A0A1I1V3C9_9ACTN|nr:tRNA pseudouridine(55) synthase TruB [Actinopolyspora alba]SFD77399.1 tRNA pseudouridine55 synthase [Actinopolyspora alba]
MPRQTRTSSQQTVPAGLLVVDKPAGMTSHDVVSRVRRIMGTRKVGHAGTLDPMATGVLVLGLERATKLLGHLALDTKAYLATVRLGSATDTDDADGEQISAADASGITESAVAAVMAELTGDIEQVPSKVSAVKINGRRAYELARSGEEVELSARPVTVSRFDLLATHSAGETLDLDVMVECSSGTYVRALARDLGERLGVGGHLARLRRTRVGPFGLATVRGLEYLEQHPELSMDLDQAVAAAFPRHQVDAATARALSHGKSVTGADLDGTYAAFDPDGHAIALLRNQGATAKPVLVLRPAG